MDEQGVMVPSVYTLTTITGRRRGDDRESVVLSFELRRKTLLLTLLGLVPASLVGMIAALFIGSYGLLVGAAALGGWAYLVMHSSRSGLRLATWRVLLDKRAARAMHGKFVQCGQVVLAADPQPVQVLSSMVFLPEEDQDASELLLVGTRTSTPDHDRGRPVTTRRTPRTITQVDPTAYDH